MSQNNFFPSTLRDPAWWIIAMPSWLDSIDTVYSIYCSKDISRNG